MSYSDLNSKLLTTKPSSNFTKEPSITSKYSYQPVNFYPSSDLNKSNTSTYENQNYIKNSESFKNPSYPSSTQNLYNNGVQKASQEYISNAPVYKPTSNYGYVNQTQYQYQKDSNNIFSNNIQSNDFYKSSNLDTTNKFNEFTSQNSNMSINSRYNQKSMKRDQRILNPPSHFVSSTVKYILNSTTLQKKTMIPIGLVFQPLAPIPRGYPEIPCVNFGNASLIRCKSCFAYINPYIRWEANGERWFCNICEKLNNTPSYYLNMKRPDGQISSPLQMDRPELSNGSFETFASGDYMNRPPQPPSFLFLIDVSLNAIQVGLVETACHAIKKVLLSKEISSWIRTKIGIITFDSTIHFYHISNETSQPQMLVVPINDVFVPLPQDVMVNAKEYMKPLISLLDNLPNIWKNNTIIDTCLGSAIDASYQALRQIGGKLSIFFSSIPSIGNQALADKSRPSLLQNEGPAKNEMHFLRPIDDAYKHIGCELAHDHISVDLYACSINSVDLASLHDICKTSAGNVYYYQQFHIRIHGDKLLKQLFHNLTSTVGWEAMMRFRVSKGLKITQWIGHFHLRSSHLLVVPHIKSDQAFSIILDYEDELSPDKCAYIQCATLFTNCLGERRLRVHTYCIPITSDINLVFDSFNASTTASILCQNALSISFVSSLSEARNYLQNKCNQIITSQSNKNSQILELLMMFILGMLKSTAFKESREISADMRIYHISRLESLPLGLQICYFYPILFSLHNLSLDNNLIDETYSIILPPALNLTNKIMSEKGAYLLDNGETMYLWIGRAISTNWIESVFMVNSIDYIYPEYVEANIASSTTSLGQRIYSIIKELRSLHGHPFIKLILIRQNDPLEHNFFMSLIEDQTESMRISLSEFMYKMGYRRTNS